MKQKEVLISKLMQYRATLGRSVEKNERRIEYSGEINDNDMTMHQVLDNIRSLLVFGVR